MQRDQLAKALYEACYITGEFLLRSGQTSNEYFDKYRFESQPQLLFAIAKHLAPLIPKDTQALAGLELGGVPVATALSLHTGIPLAFVRKEAKKYGTCKLAEGMDLLGIKTCIIEDVITTGGQVAISTKELRQEGAIINDVLCVLHRGNSNPEKLQELNLNLQALFTMEEIKNA